MSTSIFYNNLGLTLSSRIPDSMVICNREIRRVKRVLFEPPDHVSTQKFLEEELGKITLLKSEKWNFDFEKERTLNENGVYQWRPVTPQKNIRPIKKRSAPEEDTQELYGEPEIIRPTPVRIFGEEEMKSPPSKTTRNIQNHNQKPQRLITDFMMEKKRSASELAKKATDFAPMERPAKVPRLQNYKS